MRSGKQATRHRRSISCASGLSALSLEDEARADPVVQALLRSGANLLDVRPLEGRRRRSTARARS